MITTPNKTYESYRRGCDFIQKHIFPGSLCPSVNAVLSAVEEKTKFIVEDAENIGKAMTVSLSLRLQLLKDPQRVEEQLYAQ